MPRFFLVVLLLCAGPLAAQPANGPATIPSGTAVRVFLPGGPAAGTRGLVVSGTAESLRVVSPALGLAQLPADSIRRLETVGASGSRKWKFAAGVLVVGVLAGIGGASGGEDFFPMFMNGLIFSGAVAGAAYALGSPGQRAVAIDPARGLPAVRHDAGSGAPVRISTVGAPARVEYRLRDFTPDSLYLFSGDAFTPLPRAQIATLQVSMGRNRGVGARRGALIGALAGAVLAGGSTASLGDWGKLASPFAAVVGAALGGGIGLPVGSALAPRDWTDVPLPPP
jgi:hypothetical protein